MDFPNQPQPPQAQAMRPPVQARVVAQILPLPPLQGVPPVNVLEIEESGDKKKGKKKMKTKDAMPIKRTRHGDTSMKDAEPSQGNDSKAGTSKKKKKGSRRKINIDDFPLGRNATTYNLLANVSHQGLSITWP